MFEIGKKVFYSDSVTMVIKEINKLQFHYLKTL